LEATLEEVLLGKKVASLSLDGITEVLLVAAGAGVSEELFSVTAV
jgi:hypothetical protein